MENRIAELRKQHNLSQSKFSKIFNVAQNTISQWEQGKRDIDLSTLVRIAEYFDVTIDYLLCRSDSTRVSTTDTAINEETLPTDFLLELKDADSDTIREIWQYLQFLNLKKGNVLDEETAKK